MDLMTLLSCLCRWDFLPIEFLVPRFLAERLAPWINEGHKQLAAPGQRLLFVQPTSGTALTNVNVSHWWQTMLAKYEAPFRFPPSELRHIFVDERCSRDAVQSGPDNRAAARIMGNRWVTGVLAKAACINIMWFDKY